MERSENIGRANPELPRATNGPPTVSTIQARQGEASGRVRYVLAISITLAIAAFAIIYFLNF